ncbi:uncharacterized protein EI97DRAFT_424785 [Westerdykella ornata]|uniref:Uncharacterized protein n=1 Tax=Westerdykella ornata TaxID=318751 RepID=A0A6A6JA60_WESOR|nr:uncharacterized protein EI97DRAFT_424785 [Westerdykella ornata]KAF2273215.1 hypothetical protein EI97DRAFT_424785 [Westerdykella ornata]
MPTPESTSRPPDRQTRKRPFTGWMKRLANLKSSSSDHPSTFSKKNHGGPQSKTKKSAVKNNPYPESGHLNGRPNGQLSFSSPATPRSINESFTSAEGPDSDRRQALAKSNKSTAPTVATHPDTVHSGRSKAETGNSNTVGGGSTFSSPNHSERSLTTTLTTIQSTAPSNALGQNHQSTQAPSGVAVHFSHQFPTSPPPSALPPHMVPQPQPHSYQAATANNILTDDASILTLASSSKQRRRRNSLDTNASVRALAPSSVWGGSRESLPLSVLSGNPDTIYSPQNRPAVGGFMNAERASVYSSSGVAAPTLTSDRNSYYKNADGISVRSGLLGHGRTDSIPGSIGATATGPLASPRDPNGPGKLSRRSSEWKEHEEPDDDSEAGEVGGHAFTPVMIGNDVKGKVPENSNG